MTAKCSASKNNGQPCRAWAKKGSDPPLCAAHTKTADSGAGLPSTGPGSFYQRTYSLEEVADLVHLAIDHSLDDELTAARVAVRRVLTQLKEELTPTEYAGLATVIFTGANTISRLVRTSHELADKRSNKLMDAIAKAIGEEVQEG